MSQRITVYEYQQRTMPVLLAWAAGSIAAGLAWMLQPGNRRRSFWRGLGSQFAGWGAIDALIGLAALAGAMRKSKQWEAGKITPDEQGQDARTFEKIVWINAGLDVGYVWGGSTLYRRSPGDDLRRGIGVGIMLQGAFLLLWDVFLGSLMRRYVITGATRRELEG